MGAIGFDSRSGQSQQRRAYPEGRGSRRGSGVGVGGCRVASKQIKHGGEPSLIGLFWQELTRSRLSKPRRR